ncbi:MAG: hypothetical protein IJ551_07240, partial [Prevotella sp.]|nr:hypothetical protein [Prevotella sp.]
MNQALQAVRQLLNVMDVQVPHAVIAKLLDTPVGQTIRGISDALDALNIRNEVYQLPRELLQELPTPFLTVLPRQTQQFYIVTQVNSQAIEFAGHKPMGLQQFFREWDGIALTAEKTAETPIYHKVLLRNCCDWLIRYHVLLLSLLPMLITVLLFYPLDLAKVLHMAITMLGVYVSFVLLDRQYHRSSLLERFCKIGRRVNCHKVEDVSGATKWGALQLCDLSFLLFSTLLLTAIIDLFNFTSASLPLLVIACPMTVFSVVLQLLVIRSVCLFCMAVDVLVWLDIILLIFQPWAFSIAGWRSLVV